MHRSDRADIPASGTVVECRAVCKTFRQRQPSERPRDVLRNLLHPRFRTVEALRDVSFTVNRGEVVAYAGPNGAGKSTTIKLLSGMLAPTSGSVRVLGIDPVAERTRYVGRIGVVFGQRTELWWDHPVAASYEWKRVVWDIPRERFDRMCGVAREVLGVGETWNTLARELSLGQRMRADLGMAMLHEPEILFLDEPTLGLDVLAKRSMTRLVRQLSATGSVTVMVTSHDMNELEQLAGRVIFIESGSLAYDGDFGSLRREFGDLRRLVLETDNATAPTLPGAELVGSQGMRHEYRLAGAGADVAALLAGAGEQCRVLDVETHRAPIDEVIAGIYEHWGRQRPTGTA